MNTGGSEGDRAAAASGGSGVSMLVGEMLAAKGLAPVEATADLRAAGLASLDVVNLMMAVEDAFGLVLPEAAMTPENFRSVSSIEALVAGLS